MHGDSQYQSYGGPKSLELPPEYSNQSIQNDQENVLEDYVVRIESTNESEEFNQETNGTSKVVQLSSRESQLSRIQRERQNDNMLIGELEEEK